MQKLEQTQKMTIESFTMYKRNNGTYPKCVCCQNPIMVNDEYLNLNQDVHHTDKNKLLCSFHIKEYEKRGYVIFQNRFNPNLRIKRSVKKHYRLMIQRNAKAINEPQRKHPCLVAYHLKRLNPEQCKGQKCSDCPFTFKEIKRQ